MSSLQKFIQGLWALGFFSLPFSRGILVWQNTENIQSAFNPYTSVTLYGSELFFLTAFLLGSATKPLEKRQKRPWTAGTKWLMLLTIGFPGISILLAESRLGTTLAMIHLITLFIVVQSLWQGRVYWKTLKIAFLTSIGLQTILGIAQVALQHSLGLSFLGEPLLSPELPGIAKIEWGSITLLRAYGTFPHANIFAGYLLVALAMVFKEKMRFRFLLGSLLGIAFLLTYSQGAWAAAMVAILSAYSLGTSGWMLGGGIAFGLILIFREKILNFESIQERISLLKISLKMFQKYPFGVGWHQFTNVVQEVSLAKLQPWQFQPVHNIYTLLTNELGLVALIGFIPAVFKGCQAIWKRPWERSLALAMMTIGLWDHYLISLYQGIMLFALGIGLMKVKRFQQNRDDHG